MKESLFIAFEGIDGSGKSTQAHLLVDRLKEEGHRVHATCEPSGGPIGSLIRNIFSGRIEADHRTIAGLFVADRLDHLLNKTNGILKKLEEGYTVVTDRYCLSSYAYQGTHMPMDWVIEANSQSTQLLKPDLHVFIDIDPEESIRRMQAGRSTSDMYENLDNLRKVRENYFLAIDKVKGGEKVVIVDGNLPVDQVAIKVWKSAAALLNNRP
nr:dTMP kinase [Saprospiraceae bacterium]